MSRPAPLEEPAEVELIGRADAAAAMLKPLRREILGHLREPDSAAGLARRLGQPRQRLNHHLRELERAGLVELVEERRRGNCMERVVRATARAYLISPEALGELGRSSVEKQRDRTSWSYLVAVLGRALRELGLLRRGADRAGKRLQTFSLETEVRFASPQALAEFSERLTQEVARLVAEFHDQRAPGGRCLSFLIGAYPTPKSRTEDPENPDGRAQGGEEEVP